MDVMDGLTAIVFSAMHQLPEEHGPTTLDDIRRDIPALEDEWLLVRQVLGSMPLCVVEELRTMKMREAIRVVAGVGGR